MASVLIPYANSYVRSSTRTGTSLVGGRLTPTYGDTKLYRCFLKRAQYTGTSSGSKKQPLPSQLGGEMMPGLSGDAYYYRGYYLQYAVLPIDFDWLLDDYSTLTFLDVNTADSSIRPGTRVDFMFGTADVMSAIVERNTGQFGGMGIDEILYKELGGIELQLSGGEIIGTK